MKFYLAGPVGYDSKGTEWKDDIKNILRKNGQEVYDPIENDSKYPEIQRMNNMKKEPVKFHKEIKKIMNEIFFDDCKYIENCDYTICYFSGRSLGTASEQGISYYLSKFRNKKIKTISLFAQDFHPDEWTICCSDYIFFSKEELIKFIRIIK